MNGALRAKAGMASGSEHLWVREFEQASRHPVEVALLTDLNKFFELSTRRTM